MDDGLVFTSEVVCENEFELNIKGYRAVNANDNTNNFLWENFMVFIINE